MCGASVDVVTSEYHCVVCGAAFIPRSLRHRVTCGADKCRRRAAYLSERSDAAYVARNRARCAVWYEANKAQHKARVAERTRSAPCGAAGRWFITPHAVEQALARAGWERGTAYEQALAALIDESRGAHFVKRLPSGAELWRGPKPRRLRYIVRPAADGALPQLVTVLSTYDRLPGNVIAVDGKGGS